MKRTKAALGAVAILTVSVTTGALAATGALTGDEASRSAQQVLAASAGDEAPGAHSAPTYKTDETTEVLLDAEVSSDEIVKIGKSKDLALAYGYGIDLSDYLEGDFEPHVGSIMSQEIAVKVRKVQA